MNKLDLIFEKEPPEVQRKLMNLLIQYNAVMQYNQNDQKFEVDLLLPFKDSTQKQLFLKNFSSRSSRNDSLQPPKRKNSVNSRKNSQHDSRHSQDPDHHFNEHNEDFQQLKRQNTNKSDKKSSQNNIRQETGEQIEPELSFDLTAEHDTSMKKDINLTIGDVSLIIRSKIKQAVSQILAHKNRQKQNSFSSNNNIVDKIFPEQQSNSSYDNENTQQINEIDTNGVIRRLEFEKMNEKNYNSQPIQQWANENNQTNYNSIPQNRNERDFSRREESEGSSFKNQSRQQEILIEGDEVYDQNNRDQIGYERGSQDYSHQSSSVARSFDPSSKSFQYPRIIEERMQEDEDQLFKKSKNLSSEKIKKDQAKIIEMKKKLNEKYSSNKKMSSNGHNLRGKYKDFLKKNHRDIDRLYENIRKDLKRNQSHLKQSRKQDPILVLQSDINSDIHSDEDRIFKEEIIKDYHSRIVVHNQNMSSQDLVRYFRYLLQHARSLYAKQLRKGR